MLEHTALTGIVFAKFCMSQSRALSCAFSTKLFAVEDKEGDQQESLYCENNENAKFKEKHLNRRRTHYSL